MGSRYLYGALAGNNHGELAKQILNQTTYPSIGNLFERGATTFWESWGEKEIDENSAGVRSRNHPFQAGFDAWFYSGIGGIRPDPSAPGFKRIIMDPHLVVNLTFSNASYKSLYGDIISDWSIKGNDFHWSVTIPVNTTAMIHFPVDNPENILESGLNISQVEGSQFIGIKKNKSVFLIGSGKYSFTVNNFSKE